MFVALTAREGAGLRKVSKFVLGEAPQAVSLSMYGPGFEKTQSQKEKRKSPKLVGK